MYQDRNKSYLLYILWSFQMSLWIWLWQKVREENTVNNMNSNDTNMMHKFPCKHICYKSQTLYLIDESIDAFWHCQGCSTWLFTHPLIKLDITLENISDSVFSMLSFPCNSGFLWLTSLSPRRINICIAVQNCI